ncbi:MAG TPA: substrate-binding domain-containing protein [Caulobacteraceae bacterium]|nr:substrate-binding domain-containing protein [Caulobacteraceae bacterium]
MSRALNNQPAISIQTKQRIWALAQSHNYPVRTPLQSAVGGSARSIAIVTPHLQGRPLPLWHPFLLELIANIGEAARARDCDFTVSHVTPVSFDDLVIAASAGRADGVIFLGQSTLHEAFNKLTETGARFVVWGAQVSGQRYRTIGSDNLVGGRRATAHLCRLGRRRILFVGGVDLESQQRRRGYLEALREHGIQHDPELVADVHFELDAAESAVTRLLNRGVSFDGVVAASDLIALGAIRAIRRAGLAAPGDVSVVGYDDILIGQLSVPTLSTIRQDTRRAGSLLVSSILDGDSDLQGLLSTDLIIRESCGG